MTSSFIRQAVRGLVALIAPGAVAAQDGGPKVGDFAPDFTLPAATRDGLRPKPITLSGLRGQTVVLAFFPKARTGG